jgi:16S rRNA processing protein RimM
VESNPERIEIGSVASVNPARRELRVDAERGYKRALAELEWIRLVPRGGTEIRCRVAGVKAASGAIVVTLVAGVLRDTVDGLKGATVVAGPEELNEPEQDELTFFDAIGFEVFGPDGLRIGTLADVIETPAHPVLAIERDDGHEVLAPAIEEVVADIDWERERVVVNDLAPYGVDNAD